jgi:hypothetical protein
MFMWRKRRRLLDKVEGRVLEVSCGTRRNFGEYDFKGYKVRWRVESLVFNDACGVMLGRAREKWEALQAERRGWGMGRGCSRDRSKVWWGMRGLGGLL